MSRVITSLVALVVAVVLASSSMFVVDQHRYAVVYAMGELRETIKEPGLYFKLPAPLQNVVWLDKRLQTLDTPDGERYATAEKKELLVDAFVKWKIVDPRRYLVETNAGAERAGAERGGEKMTQIVRTALAAETATRSVADVVSGQRGALGAAVRERVAKEARVLGVEVVDVRLKRIDFPDQVSAAVIERMKAERMRVANEVRAGAAAEGQQIRGDAERQRATILAEAQRDAETIRGDGDAKASQIYAASFGKNPEFYRFYRSMEAYKATFKGKSDILVLDANSEFFKYFKGPGAGK
ncbi:protease modulator HflC [uncultured Massilia sp.]|uniref:protease modulator HflC n=1 Tax=uncultured Massilia sp. TaxID=169973 RepID=UPI0025E473DC|nr:protease modulator HflC [uncultured Massilia sp.]